jgi:hypothetical protein
MRPEYEPTNKVPLKQSLILPTQVCAAPLPPNLLPSKAHTAKTPSPPTPTDPLQIAVTISPALTVPSQTTMNTPLHIPTLPRRKDNDQPQLTQLHLTSHGLRGSAVANMVRPSDHRGHIRRALEVVVARHSEDLGWLSQIPEYWQVIVYNKVPLSSVSHDCSCYPNTELGRSPYKT